MADHVVPTQAGQTSTHNAHAAAKGDIAFITNPDQLLHDSHGAEVGAEPLRRRENHASIPSTTSTTPSIPSIVTPQDDASPQPQVPDISATPDATTPSGAATDAVTIEHVEHVDQNEPGSTPAGGEGPLPLKEEDQAPSLTPTAAPELESISEPEQTANPPLAAQATDAVPPTTTIDSIRISPPEEQASYAAATAEAVVAAASEPSVPAPIASAAAAEDRDVPKVNGSAHEDIVMAEADEPRKQQEQAESNSVVQNEPPQLTSPSPSSLPPIQNNTHSQATQPEQALSPRSYLPAYSGSSIHQQVVDALTAEGNDELEPASHQANNLEVDSDELFTTDSDADSALGVSLRNSTASLSESVMQYREENGRTYHGYKDGKYVLPNDDAENERLDLQHHMFMLTLEGKLNLAPLRPDIQRVLDIGTGTGIWAIEFAQQFPSAEVIGTDLSPIQPLYVPPNLRFEICDAEEEWDFSQPFDYVHGRMMTVCFRDISVIFREAFKSLKSGGWLEMQDLRFPILSDDGTLEGTAIKKWNDYVLEASEKLGRSWNQGHLYVKHLQDAGFVDITEVRYDWPIGPWPKNSKDKEIGLWCRENFLVGMQGISMAVLTRGLGWTREQVEVFLVDVRKDALNRRIHAYIPVYFVFARKP